MRFTYVCTYLEEKLLAKEKQNVFNLSLHTNTKNNFVCSNRIENEKDSDTVLW